MYATTLIATVSVLLTYPPNDDAMSYLAGLSVAQLRRLHLPNMKVIHIIKQTLAENFKYPHWRNQLLELYIPNKLFQGKTFGSKIIDQTWVIFKKNK